MWSPYLWSPLLPISCGTDSLQVRFKSMQFIGLIMVLAGIFFVNSSIKNRPPIRTIKALIDDPSDVNGTLNSFEGKWQTPENTYSASFGNGGATGTEFTPDPAGDAKQGKTGENG